MSERIYNIRLTQSSLNLYAQALHELPAKVSRLALNDLEAQVAAADKAEQDAYDARIREEAQEALKSNTVPL